MVMFNKLKEFKDLGKLGGTDAQKEQQEMQARLNEICDAVHVVLKEKKCTVQETIMAFQAIQNGLTSILQRKKVEEIV